MLGAGLGIFFAVGIRVVDCKEEASSICSTASLFQLLVAIAGLIPEGGTLVQSIRPRGHPLPWFFITAVVYVMWGLYVWQAFGS
ncbi:hypothetical protein BH09ACT13_BH09ACT13_10760 [soil metagenome]